MTLTSVLLYDENDDEAGTIRLPSQKLNRAIRGDKVAIAVEELALQSGAPVDLEALGIRASGRDRLEIEAIPNIFGKGSKWRYRTNKFGAYLVRRIATHEDAELFRFWIAEAAGRPGRLASALIGCTSPDEYRAALNGLRRNDARAMAPARGTA